MAPQGFSLQKPLFFFVTKWFPELRCPGRGGVCWGKSGVGVELEPKEPQQPHQAGGQGGAWEECSGPCRRRRAPPGNGGQDGGCGHTCTCPAWQTTLIHQTSMPTAHTHPRPKRGTCVTCPPLALPSHCVASGLSFPSEHRHAGCGDQKNRLWWFSITPLPSHHQLFIPAALGSVQTLSYF